MVGWGRVARWQLVEQAKWVDLSPYQTKSVVLDQDFSSPAMAPKSSQATGLSLFVAWGRNQEQLDAKILQ